MQNLFSKQRRDEEVKKIFVHSILFFLLLASFTGCNFERMINKLAMKKMAPRKLSIENLQLEKTISKCIALDTILNTNFRISLLEGLNTFIPRPFPLCKKFYFAVKDSNCYQLFFYDLTEKTLSKIPLLIDSSDFQEDKNTKTGTVVDIALNEKYLVLATEKIAFVFSRNDDRTFRYRFGFEIPSSINGFFVKDEYLYLVDLRYSSKAKNSEGTRLIIINLVEKKLVGILPIPIEHLEFLIYAPNKYWAVNLSRNLFLLANPLKLEFHIYKLNNFDLAYRITDTANIYWKDFKSEYYDTLCKTNKELLRKDTTRVQPASFIYKLGNVFDEAEGSKIVFVDFVDDTTFWVTYTSENPKMKKNKVFYCDIWRYDLRRNSWFKLDTGLVDAPPVGKLKATKENFYLLSWSFPPSFSDKYIANFQLSAPMEIMLPKDNETYEEIFKKRDQFFSDKEPLWQLYIYKWK
ncbi:hypothetical protein D9V87_02170 [Bacteroidetes/Chlorobi group bacterium MS-B_bin-24]|nr:MAG: hypothetical protein D9V87_02170 [Bacteroidetes/Chlorobi group bacterium MS-B_bin-24]